MSETPQQKLLSSFTDQPHRPQGRPFTSPGLRSIDASAAGSLKRKDARRPGSKLTRPHSTQGFASKGQKSPTIQRFLTPSPAFTYSSTPPQHLEILKTEFSLKETSKENKTSLFIQKPDQNDLLLRRGNILILKIHTSLLLSCEYTVSLVFVATRMKRERYGEFRANGSAKDAKELWLSISIPANFPVGRFLPHITLTLKGVPEVFTHFHEGSITVLFNPWNPEDDSYVQHEEDREEYLLCDKGILWRGNNRQPLATPWKYGQYEEGCLDAALNLLSSLGPEECRSAKLVSRCVISRINARDNSGVMVAGYSGNMSAGIHPCRWSGSAVILQKYLRTKFPVKYGQCFVFSAVAVTVLRALGIAARPITCYNCALETETKGRVKRFFSSDGDLIHGIIQDSVWVYHVWVEAWMRRDDLPMGFDGWQALDPTCSVNLSGKFRVGPASVLAVHEGLMGRSYPYNGEIIHGEIVSEIQYLQIPAGADYSSSAQRHASLVFIDREEVAPLICTSHHDKLVPVDVTEYYRSSLQQDPGAPASADGNAQQLHRVSTVSMKKKKKVSLPLRDCSVQVATMDGAELGDPVQISVKISNNSVALRQIAGKVVGKVVRYNGAVVQNFMSLKFSGVVNPGQDASVSLPIETKKYVRYLTEQAMLQFFVIVTVKETQQVFIKLHNFRFKLPVVDIVCPAQLTLGASFRVKLKFKNNLPFSLSHVRFLVEGKGLCPMRELSHKRLVLPGAQAVVEFPITASCLGSHWLLVSLHCDQVTDIRGWAEITVVTPTSQSGSDGQPRPL